MLKKNPYKLKYNVAKKAKFIEQFKIAVRFKDEYMHDLTLTIHSS